MKEINIKGLNLFNLFINEYYDKESILGEIDFLKKILLNKFYDIMDFIDLDYTNYALFTEILKPIVMYGNNIRVTTNYVVNRNGDKLIFNNSIKLSNNKYSFKEYEDEIRRLYNALCNFNKYIKISY